MKRFPRLATALAVVAFPIFAKPPRPETRRYVQPDGSTIDVRLNGNMFFHYYSDADGRPLIEKEGVFFYAVPDSAGVLQPTSLRASDFTAHPPARICGMSKEEIIDGINPGASGVIPGIKPGTNFPASGDRKVLIILVETPDVKFTLKDPYDYFNRMANEPGFSDWGGTGSIADWFLENSMGKFRPEFDVFGPVTVSENMAYYGEDDERGNETHVWEMVAEACSIIDPMTDFSQYDCDGDGTVDNVYIYYAGTGQSATQVKEEIWPHAWSVSYLSPEPVVFDGVKLDHYACSNEWETYYEGYTEKGRPDGVGTFTHEFSHVMGLPDLYATNGSKNILTPLSWSVLDMGTYNNNSRTPPLYSSWERLALGWIEPFEINSPADVELPGLIENTAAIITTSSPNEYFLFENRQKTGWDTYLPDSGMLVWHIDYNSRYWTGNSVNNDKSHQRVDIVEAYTTKAGTTNRYAAFPGQRGITSFTFGGTPSFQTWAGTDLGLPITDIKEEKGVVTFKVAGGKDAGVSNPTADTTFPVQVHNLQGIFLMEARNASELQTLPKGMYIISGKKVRL